MVSGYPYRFDGLDLSGSDGDDHYGRRPSRGPVDLVLLVHRGKSALSVTVTVQGELDLATAPVLRQCLAALLAEGAEQVVVDLCAVPFCDVAGLRVLVWAQSQLPSRGGQLTVLRPCRSLEIMTGLFGLTDLNLTSPHAAPTSVA